MRPRSFAVAVALLSACRDHSSRASKLADSAAARAPAAASKSPAPDHVTRTYTAVFEDEVERTPRAAPRAPSGPPAPKGPADLSRISSSLAGQLADRGGIQWNPARPLQWSDFQAAPQPAGREAALSMTGQISGSTCFGSQFQYGVIAAFIPSGSWVLPRVAADPQESAIALGHERLHFDITEIIARELRQRLASVEKPCEMTEAQRDEMGAAAFEEEKRVQQRYDDETTHGLDRAAQARWAAWAVNSLSALQGFAAPMAAREN